MIFPLRKSQKEKLNIIGLDDLQRKCQELINFCNKTDERMTKIEDQCFFGKNMTYGVCNEKKIKEDDGNIEIPANKEFKKRRMVEIKEKELHNKSAYKPKSAQIFGETVHAIMNAENSYEAEMILESFVIDECEKAVEDYKNNYFNQ